MTSAEHTCTPPASGFTNDVRCDTILASRMLSIFYRTILDALFPLSPVEEELFSWSPEEALCKLTPAPDFSGLAVALPGAKSIFAYKDERVSRLIWNIKYKRSARAVKIGGYALFKKLVDSISVTSQRNILMIPIPITQKKRRERGYNQCELILDEIKRLQDVMPIHHLVFEKMLLMRIGDTSEQKLKDRASRIKTAHSIFTVHPDIAATYDKNTPIIVVDDVITTGSTMYEAIDTLKKAGFTDVRALSLAH